MKSLTAALRVIAGPALAALIAFAWFVRWAGWAVLDPTELAWLLTGDDWTPHYLGWAFFRNESLTLPLGELEGLLHPVGTTLGYVDANPLVSLILRPFSELLPRPFQFIGPWLALCCVLQGIFGARLAARFTSNALLQGLSGGLLATSPMLITRSGHDTLCAQWILIGLISLHFGAVHSAAGTRRAFAGSVLLVFLAAMIHPYLAAMALALAVGLVGRLVWEGAHPRRFLSGLVGTALLVLVTLGVFALLGYFGGGVTSTSSGFGAHTSDLTSLINPRGQSRFLPDLAASRSSYEGWGFLGAGLLLAGVLAAITLLLRRREAAALPWRRLLPLLIVTFGLTLFALGNELNLGPHTLLRLDFFFDPLGPLTAIFRASGRFIWVAHYMLAAGAIAVLLRFWRDRALIAGVALSAALLVQWIDFDWKGAGVFTRPGSQPLQAATWEQLRGDYEHVVLVPPQAVYGPTPCGGELPGRAWVLFGELASRLGLTLNSGYAARYNTAALAESCRQTIEQVGRGELDPRSVYVLSGQALRRARWAGRSVQCGVVERFNVCVAGERDTPLRRELAQ